MNSSLTHSLVVSVGSVAALLSVALSASATGTLLHDGLVTYWALDENTGSVAGDSAPFGTVTDNGSLRNAPTWIDGIFGAGLQFNGTNQDVLIFNSNDMDINASAVTLSAWVKLNQLPSQISGSYSGILDSQPDNYVMYLDKSNDELRFKVTTANGSAARPGIPASNLNTSDWLHVMGVYGGNGNASIYYNGELASVVGAGGLTGPVRIGQTAGIGSQVTAASPHGSSSLFQGAIADMAVWNRALGLAESQYLYNGGIGNAVGVANPFIEPVEPEPPDNPSIYVEAHRGYSSISPENTLVSITASAGFADLVEFDVRVSQDNRLVLMHDGSLGRTTNGSGNVASQNYVGYMDGLDAGSWFSSEFTGEKVPLMSEAVEHTFSLGMTPLIERKTGDAVMYVNELNGLGVLDDSVIIAFDWNFLGDVRALDAEVKLGALGSGTINSTVINNAINAGADFLDWNDGGINQAAVDLVHAAGLELHVWTVNNLSRMQQLIDLGVDGITTDAPETLRSIVPWPAMPGDFNGDLVVNAADYAFWRDRLGTPGEYNEWKTNFGNEAGSGAFAQTTVPEPSTWILTALATMACLVRKARSAKNSANFV